MVHRALLQMACCVMCCTVAGEFGLIPDARAEDRSTAAYFRSDPAGRLIHRLKPMAGRTALPPELVLVQKRQWFPEVRVLVIDTQLVHQGKKAVTIKRIPAAQWNFPAIEEQAGPDYRPLTYLNDKWYGSTFWTGPDWTRVGKDWHHPGINTPSIRSFQTPRDGRVSITGRLYKLDPSGDGVRASVRHGRRTVWMTEIAGNDTKGTDLNLTLDVRKGERIRFVVHKRKKIEYDTTRFDPIVTYPDGERYQASRGFSTSKQGDGGWSYEMEMAPRDERGPPHVYGFTPEMDFRDETLGVGGPVTLRSEDLLPAVVVADEVNRSGIVLGIDATDGWQMTCDQTEDETFQLNVIGGGDSTPRMLQPGQSIQLPRIALASYGGPWQEGLAKLQEMLDSKDDRLGMIRLNLHFAATGGCDLALCAMVHAEWAREDQLIETAESYAAATARHLGKARLLLDDLRRNQAEHFLAAEARELQQLTAQAKTLGGGKPNTGAIDLRPQRSLYRRVRSLKREIALANPLMQFGPMMFCKRVPTSYSHLVMQYFGWRARAGGGLFVLESPGRSLRCRDITGGALAEGCVLEPRLSYDGRRIVFSYVRCKDKELAPGQIDNENGEGHYHVYEVNIDGTALRRLTDGPYDDLMPTYLPDGGIVFSSTRRRGYARCFGGQFSRRWHIYTLHRMDGDGKNLRMLSCHDTNEWFPEVANDGRIIYARWDYIDRDAVTHQNLWAMRPDGTNPTTVWGNATTSPHCSFQAKSINGTKKFVFAASAHHSITAGSIAIVDPTIDYDGQDAITRITPEVRFPEAEDRNIREYYASPWPLSEKYFLVAYSSMPLVWEPGANPANAMGIYLLDKFGNRELIYRDPEIGSTNPTPLVPRPLPSVVSSNLFGSWHEARSSTTGEMLLADVYQGLGDVPRGSIRQLRIIQIFPKTTNLANNPHMGIAGEENGRAILGTVPVEPDGSARLILPAMKPVLFQALDKDGFAYQTMRTLTYVQPGESVSCIGCHENRMTAPAAGRIAAASRPPSQIDPGPLGGRPFSYVEMVQPVLDKHCVECHGGKKIEGKVDLTGAPVGAWSRSYVALTRDPRLVPRYPARNQIQVTVPGGRNGALGSRLMRLVREGHEGVKLSAEEIRALAAWIDCNAIFYGSPDPADQALQRRGQPVSMPEIQ